MKLEKLLKNIQVEKIIGNTDLDILDIQNDSNLVTKNSLYICLKGDNFDGCDFVKQAQMYGAIAIITDREIDTHLTQVIVANTRKAMSIVASNFYNEPKNQLKIIGVFGTNGKTTTSHLITSILQNANIKCGLIGTLGTFFNSNVKEPSLTTPDPIALHKTFREMVDNGVEVVIMEISAHAIYYDKVYGIDFSVVVFTNFSQDHLDFFGNMENYKRAKLKLIKENEIKVLVVNSDDSVGREILKLKPKALTYGIDNPADVFAIDIFEGANETNFVINLFDSVYAVALNIIGRFNVYNALGAASVCALFGVATDKVICGLESLKGVNGRVESVFDGDYNILIDYAHTPDGLEKVLKTLRPIAKNRLICLFGCGGNRDSKKREIMGEISAKNCDFTIVTSDNPRYEEPMQIIREIEKGILKQTKNFILIEDRVEAIKYAINMLQEGDILLIAGKGGEKYQEIYGIKHLYNDKDTVKELLKKNRE